MRTSLRIAQEAGGGTGPAREVEMGDMVVRIARWLTDAVELGGIAILVLGAIVATLLFLRDGLMRHGWEEAYELYRANLGRGILLGLELLVIADIIATIAARTDFQSVAVLGLIVLIRTFLSFSLEVEIKGRWPWREAEARAAEAGDPTPKI